MIQTPAPPPAIVHELTASDLAAYLDGFLPLQIGQNDVAGVVIAVVKDGKLLFAKGYGYADVAKRIPVSPDSTLFRPGSISKLFTWTAVMQQVEQGKLDLDRDVNAYLDFTVPPAFGKPITLRDLMTHRAGFQETEKGMEVTSPSGFVPLHDYLAHHMPDRIFPPGTVSAYSNYGATLAAYIVTRVSGEPFDDYIERHIFAPLGMQHATFRQPLPPRLAPLVSNGYDVGSGEAKPFELIEVAPVGALSTTAMDMTRFMIAHLQNGGPLLSPATARMMHARQSGWPDSVDAMCLGFYESSRNGHRIISHGGDTELFHSDLHLLLDDGVGFFVSYNSRGRDAADPRVALLNGFMDRYFPDTTPRPRPTSTALADAQAVAGVYKSTRRFQTNLLAPFTLLTEATVSADPTDSALVLEDETQLNGQPRRFREIAPMRFREFGTTEEASFRTDNAGHRIGYTDDPTEALQQVGWLDSKAFNYGLLGFSLGVVVLTLLGWPAAAMIRAHYGRPLALDDDARRLRALVRVTCILIVGFVVAFGFLANALAQFGAISDLTVHLVQVLGLLCGLGAIVAISASVQSWREANAWMWSRIWSTALALACVGFVWLIAHWHLLNFNLNY